jgi:hypothetical protein
MTRRSWFTIAASIVLASGAAAVWAGVSIDVPVSGKKLLIRDNVDATKRKAVYLSRDPTFTTAGLDPLSAGARFFLLNTTVFQVDSFDLPAVGWTDRGNGQFRYKDKDMLYGPIINARIKNGLVKIVAKGDQMTYTLLDGPPSGQGTISAHLVLTGRFICSVFPGMEGVVKKDDSAKGVYRVVKAEAPSDSCAQILD